MVSLLVHAILGIVVIAFVVKSNPAIFRRVAAGPALSKLEIAYWVIGIVSLPLFTTVDGLRRGVRRPWLFFVSSLFTSCVFAFAFYFATIERQRRHKLIASPAESVL